MVVISYHLGDAFGNASATTRQGFYGVSGTPTVKLDGSFGVVGGIHYGTMYPVYRDYYETRRGVPTDLEIELRGDYDSTGRQGSVDVIVRNAGGSAVGGQLQVAVVEYIAYPWQGLDSLYTVERAMLPSAAGEAITVPAGDSVILARDYTIDPGWVAGNCHLVAFVQNNSTKEIYQGGWTAVQPRPRPAYYAAVPGTRAEPGVTLDLDVALLNAGSADAAGVTAELSTADPYLTVITGSASFGNIARAATGWSGAPCEVEIAPGCPDPHLATLDLDVSSANGPDVRTSFPLLVTTEIGLVDDMERGDRGWTHSGTRDGWHQTTHRSSSASHSWYSGTEGSWQYTNENDARLVTPFFTLDAPATVGYQHYYRTEADYDYCLVEANNGSEFWRPVASYTGIGGGWVAAEHDLAGLAGQTVQVRFRFLSDYNVTEEGWYIDDFRAGTTTGVSEDPGGRLALDIAGANPVRDRARLRYALPAGCAGTARVYDAGGRLVRRLASGIVGTGTLTWDLADAGGSKVGNGTYFLRLSAPGISATGSVAVLR